MIVDFLMTVFDNNENIHPEVVEIFQKFYPSNIVLLLLWNVYGLKQSAKIYWITNLEEILCNDHINMKS